MFHHAPSNSCPRVGLLSHATPRKAARISAFLIELREIETRGVNRGRGI